MRMSPHIYGPIDGDTPEDLNYPMYYVPGEWIAAPILPRIRTRPGPSAITREAPPFATSYPSSSTTFDHGRAFRTDYDVLQRAQLPAHYTTSTHHASHVSEANSTQLDNETPTHSHGHHSGSVYSSPGLAHHITKTNHSYSLNPTTTLHGDHHNRKTTSTAPNHHSLPTILRRHQTHLESEKKRRE